MNEEEIWKDIPGYEGYYQASNKGQIRSIPRLVGGAWPNSKKRQRGKIIGGGMYPNGYCLVVLSKDGKYTTTSKHILTAKAFIPNPENKRCVNHKNSIRTDNRVENLEWVTHKENTRHGRLAGRIKFSGKDSHWAKLTEKQVLEIREICAKVNRPTFTSIAIQYKTTLSNIGLIRKRINWKHI